MTTCSPSPNHSNGRRRDGKFAAGNKGGPGNPHSHLVAALRTAMFEAVTPEDVKSIVATLVELARKGNITAAREVLDRCLGRPLEADLIERIEAVESAVPEAGGK